MTYWSLLFSDATLEIFGSSACDKEAVINNIEQIRSAKRLLGICFLSEVFGGAVMGKIGGCGGKRGRMSMNWTQEGLAETRSPVTGSLGELKRRIRLDSR